MRHDAIAPPCAWNDLAAPTGGRTKWPVRLRGPPGHVPRCEGPAARRARAARRGRTPQQRGTPTVRAVPLLRAPRGGRAAPSPLARRRAAPAARGSSLPRGAASPALLGDAWRRNAAHARRSHALATAHRSNAPGIGRCVPPPAPHRRRAPSHRYARALGRHPLRRCPSTRRRRVPNCLQTPERPTGRANTLGGFEPPARLLCLVAFAPPIHRPATRAVHHPRRAGTHSPPGKFSARASTPPVAGAAPPPAVSPGLDMPPVSPRPVALQACAPSTRLDPGRWHRCSHTRPPLHRRRRCCIRCAAAVRMGVGTLRLRASCLRSLSRRCARKRRAIPTGVFGLSTSAFFNS